MPDQNNDTLEAALLRKASSIGKYQLPEPTLSMMPLPPAGRALGLAKNISPGQVIDKLSKVPDSIGDWLDPGGFMWSKNPTGKAGEEMARLLGLKGANMMRHNAKRGYNWLTEGTPLDFSK